MDSELEKLIQNFKALALCETCRNFQNYWTCCHVEIKDHKLVQIDLPQQLIDYIDKELMKTAFQPKYMVMYNQMVLWEDGIKILRKELDLLHKEKITIKDLQKSQFEFSSGSSGS